MSEINFNSIDFNKYRDEFVEKLGTFENYKIEGVWDEYGYPGNSIFPSEALAIYSMVKEFKVDMLIDNGHEYDE